MGLLQKSGLILIISSCLFLTGCGRKEPPREKMPPVQAGGKEDSPVSCRDENGVGHRVLSFNLEGLTDKGDKKWEVIGRTARSISENEIRLDDIVAKTYGDEEAVIMADQGVYDKSNNNVRLEKNVRAVIEDAGSTMEEQMGFSIDSAPRKEEAPPAADASVPPKKKKIIITCDGEVEFHFAKNLAYFKDNVRVYSDDGNIVADKITVNLEPNSRKINDILAQGNVVITQKENVAHSDKARYNEKEETVSLSGNPRIEMEQEDGGIMREKITEN